jgi:hypothetical protein
MINDGHKVRCKIMTRTLATIGNILSFFPWKHSHAVSFQVFII